MEIWKPIPLLSGLYEASDAGRIRRALGEGWSGGRPLRQVKDQRGRLCVSPTIGGRKITARVSVLIADAFLGPRPDGMVVRHIDDVLANNAPSNLAYGTQMENMEDREKNGRTARGVAVGRAKLDDDQVREIRNLRGLYSKRELGEGYGVSHTVIWQVQSGKCWGHVDAHS